MLMIIYNNYGTFAFNMSVVLDNCALMIQDTRFKGLSLYYKSSLHDEVHTERRGVYDNEFNTAYRSKQGETASNPLGGSRRRSVLSE